MIIRAIISITGIVQGVGFRPFVYRLSQKYSINGYIINDISGVKIEAEADEEKLNYFINEIKFNKPPLSIIYDINYIYETPSGYSGFVIRESKNSADPDPDPDPDPDSDIDASVKVKKAAVSPDIATCDNCLSELLNPANRRFIYPFINCTNCGPRFTITKKLPYDRANTTMDKFKMCNECLEEYANPLDRRFHAQPNACFNCGPEIEFIDKNGKKFNDIFGNLTSLIKDGGIVAVKGIGGFHIMCDAANEDAVNRLRMSKNRPKKPFAVMFKNVSEILKYAQANEFEIDLLNSKERPIVLLKYKGGLAKNINCGLKTIGAFLPYTPIHHIIFSIINIPLVATSGNISDEPIIADDKEALVKLGKFTDGLLVYDREIYRKCDDSVIKVIAINNGYGYNDYYKNNNKLNTNSGKFYFLEDNCNSYNNVNYNLTNNNDNNHNNNNHNNHENNKNNKNNNNYNNNYLNIIVRRSRGFVPSAVDVPFKLKRNIIAVGSNLKNTFAYGIKDSDKIILSQHIGDLNNLYSYEHFCRCIEETIAFYDFKPDIIISDMHPGYEGTKFAGEFAEKFNIPHIKLQHHKAHIISCMAENMLPLENDILGVSWDGTGYGEDKTIWGGEFFEGNYLNLNRIGSFKKFKLIGSEKAIKQPQRIFLSLMFEILGDKIINICDDNNNFDNNKNISDNTTKINNEITSNNNHDNINNNIGYNNNAENSKNRNSNNRNDNDKNNNNSDNDDNIQRILIQEISGFSVEEIRKLYKLWKNDINSPETSSVGRLFDAVSCMCGFKGEVTYEGEAAVFLENSASSYLCLNRTDNYYNTNYNSNINTNKNKNDNNSNSNDNNNTNNNNSNNNNSNDNFFYNSFNNLNNKLENRYNYKVNIINKIDAINNNNNNNTDFIIDWIPIILDIFNELIELRKSVGNLYNYSDDCLNSAIFSDSFSKNSYNKKDCKFYEDKNLFNNNINNIHNINNIMNNNCIEDAKNTDIANLNIIAVKFINTLVSVVLDASLITGKSNICLSGGVFQNSVLTGKLFSELKKRGLFVFINQKVSINDGGISLGQALYGGIIEF
ncbi:MAG: carbamoyltransferase HypF [bacterium]